MKKTLFFSLMTCISLSATPASTFVDKTSKLPLLQDKIPITVSSGSNPIGLSLITGIRNDTYTLSNVNGTLGKRLEVFTRPIGSGSYPALFNHTAQKWNFSQGKVYTQTKSVGLKIDAWILPFMQIFASSAYLNITQKSNLGDVNIPIAKNLTADHFTYYANVLPLFGVSLSNTTATFHIGELQSNLEGWFAMGGTNLVYDYKGFFLSCVIAGGYVTLNDTTQGIKNFIQRSFVYIAPKIGYSFAGIADAYFGIQRMEVFGKNVENTLNLKTHGLAQSYQADMSKFPLDFIIGTSLKPIKDFTLSFEYIISPDVKGINAEIAYRF